MGLISKTKDMSKPDKSKQEIVEITITHAKGEEWCFDINESKLQLFKNGLAACFSGTEGYVLVEDVDGDSFVFGSELLKNSGIMIIK